MQCETELKLLSICRLLRKRPFYADPKQGPCSDSCWHSEAAAAVRQDAGPAGSAQPAVREGSIVDIDAAAAIGMEQKRPTGSSAPDRAAAEAVPAAQAGVAGQHSLAGRQRILRCKADCFHLLHCHGKSVLLQ